MSSTSAALKPQPPLQPPPPVQSQQQPSSTSNQRVIQSQQHHHHHQHYCICSKFVPQAFNTNKCQQCFNFKEMHSQEALAEFSKVSNKLLIKDFLFSFEIPASLLGPTVSRSKLRGKRKFI